MLGCEGSGGEIVGGALSGFPVIGEELVEPVNGMSADAVKDVAGVGERAVGL